MHVGLYRTIHRFIQLESASGILTIVAALLALVCANSVLGPWYFHLLETPITLGLGPYALSKPLHFWVNDGLMVSFFFLVGLEVKRELLIGELSSVRLACLPVAAALGGMLFPAVIYSLFNAPGTAAHHGWGIPTVTDIAFSLCVLTLLGNRVPLGLKVFLTALAIVDDLGAILIIALFYTTKLALPPLVAAGVIIGALLLLNRLAIRYTVLYVLAGLALWLCFLQSGIHTTVAGVLLSLCIPIQDRRNPDISPLQQMEYALHPWVSYLVLPLFAFANAGVVIEGNFLPGLLHPVALGILFGLILGKQLGVILFSWLSVRFGLAELPEGVNWRHIYGVSWLAAIGFTMSLFITHLAFPGGDYLRIAKSSILFTSFIAGLLGYLMVGWLTRPANATVSG